jgi:hypothetical protein
MMAPGSQPPTSVSSPLIAINNDIVTIVIDPKNALGKQFNQDGTKSTSVQVSMAFAEQRQVPTTKEMAAVLKEVSENQNAALINASFPGIPVGEMFVILSESQFKKRLGLSTRDEMLGVHSVTYQGKTY